MDLNQILDENYLVFKQMAEEVERNGELTETARKYKEFGDKIGVGTIGLAYYIMEYLSRKSG